MGSDFYEEYWTRDDFDPDMGHPDEVFEALAAAVAPTSDCLELGCGNGRPIGHWLTDHGHSYRGFDISEAAIAQAKAAGLSAVALAPEQALPVESESIDVAVSLEVLEHTFRPDEALAELLRVLRPGGKLIVTVPNIAYWRRRTDLLLGRWNPYGDRLAVRRPWCDPHIRFFTASALRRCLATVGFTGIDVDGVAGSLIAEIPTVRRFARGSSGSRAYKAAERAFPGLLGQRLLARAIK